MAKKKVIKKVKQVKVEMLTSMGGPNEQRFAGEIWQVGEFEARRLIKKDFAKDCDQTLEACNV